MKGKKVKLGDYIDTLKGFAFKSAKYTSNGTPIVRASNFTFESISYDDIRYYSNEDALQYNKYRLSPFDVLVQTVGSWQYNPASVVGKVVCVPTTFAGALLNQNIVKLSPMDNQSLDNRFLYYRLKNNDFKQHNLGNAVGAANQASITLDTIKAFTFNLPSIESQRRIANILSAYDDLIGNNQKQIQLLEEAALRIYKEWFVNLHFPGYEHTPIVDGMPVKWKHGILSDIVSFRRGKTITKDKTEKGIVPVVAGGIEPAYYHNKANTVSPLITISASGANAGFTRMYYEDVWASDCSVLDSSDTERLYFVYAYLINSKEQIKNLQRGAAQPHVYPKDINALQLLLPMDELIQDYCSLISEYYNKIACLNKIVKYAIDARDKLLPKLMSGEIEV